MRVLAGILLSAMACFALAAFVYRIPAVHERLSWRLTVLRAEIQYTLNPPEEAVFRPTQVAALPTPTSSPTASPSPSPTAGPTATSQPTFTPAPSPTPLPAAVRLVGVKHEYQKFNNCGPANLSMALSFWGWQGDQRDTAAYLKPLQADKNVMPYEMVNFVQENTTLRLLVRVGGDLDMVRRLVAAGFPPILEMGYEPPKKDWMGHFELVTGYDDERRRLIVQDTYIMPDLPLPYDQVERYWQHFNYTYLILYPPEKEAQVLALLGPMADEETNIRHALALAEREIQQSQGRKLYFAWFNRGTNMVRLQDFYGAAQSYDQAFAVYSTLDLDERPWRNLWYQTGPYFAYFYTGRYYDVINLATNILNNMDEPIHEESLYWRAMAKEALGDREGAIADLRASLQVHPGFGPSLAQLERMGVEP